MFPAGRPPAPPCARKHRPECCACMFPGHRCSSRPPPSLIGGKKAGPLLAMIRSDSVASPAPVPKSLPLDEPGRGKAEKQGQWGHNIKFTATAPGRSNGTMAATSPEPAPAPMCMQRQHWFCCEPWHPLGTHSSAAASRPLVAPLHPTACMLVPSHPTPSGTPPLRTAGP